MKKPSRHKHQLFFDRKLNKTFFKLSALYNLYIWYPFTDKFLFLLPFRIFLCVKLAMISLKTFSIFLYQELSFEKLEEILKPELHLINDVSK